MSRMAFAFCAALVLVALSGLARDGVLLLGGASLACVALAGLVSQGWTRRRRAFLLARSADA